MNAVSGQNRSDLSVDPRVARTRATLKQALMELLRRKDWNAITAASLCRYAGIARSSFYEHYKSKSELLDEIFQERMDNISISANPSDPLGTLDWLFDHVNEAPDFLQNAMFGGRTDMLLPRFRIALVKKLEEELELRCVEKGPFIAAFVAGGALSLLARPGYASTQQDLQAMARGVITAAGAID